MVDLVKDGGSGNYKEITSKNDLQTYLASVSGDSTDSDNTKAFDNAAHAKRVWDTLDTCNATL